MRLLFRTLLLVVVPIVAATAAGPLSAAPAPPLFPLVSGATWVRVSEDGAESASRVAGTRTVGGRPCTVVERKAVERGRERVFRTCYQMTASEVVVLETTNPRGEQVTLNPPRVALKLPPRAGQTWSWSPADSAFEFKISEKWIGEETIKVKAGTFRAWKLQTITTGEESEITAYTWFAPGVGAVRTERKGHRGDRQIAGWSELVRYKIP